MRSVSLTSADSSSPFVYLMKCSCFYHTPPSAPSLLVRTLIVSRLDFLFLFQPPSCLTIVFWIPSHFSALPPRRPVCRQKSYQRLLTLSRIISLFLICWTHTPPSVVSYIPLLHYPESSSLHSLSLSLTSYAILSFRAFIYISVFKQCFFFLSSPEHHCGLST